MVPIISLLNKVIAAVGSVLGGILSLLPDSPFLWVQSIDSEVLNAINWIFPVGTIITHLEAYVVAVAAYYAIRLVLKWLKVAGS